MTNMTNTCQTIITVSESVIIKRVNVQKYENIFFVSEIKSSATAFRSAYLYL